MYKGLVYGTAAVESSISLSLFWCGWCERHPRHTRQTRIKDRVCVSVCRLQQYSLLSRALSMVGLGLKRAQPTPSVCVSVTSSLLRWSLSGLASGSESEYIGKWSLTRRPLAACAGSGYMHFIHLFFGTARPPCNSLHQNNQSTTAGGCWEVLSLSLFVWSARDLSRMCSQTCVCV